MKAKRSNGNPLIYFRRCDGVLELVFGILASIITMGSPVTVSFMPMRSAKLAGREK